MKHNWEYQRLGEVCEIYQPQTISSKELIEGGRYNVYGANGIIGRYNQYNHEFSEVLLTCRGATCGTINVSTPKSWINGNAMVIHPINSQLSTRFLKYLMNSLDYSSIITGAAQPQITRQSISPVKIPIPPAAEQEQIVAELDKLNEMIAIRKEQLKELDNLAQSLFYETFGDPITNPKGWETKSFEKCLVKVKYPSKLQTVDYALSGEYPIISQEDKLISGYTDIIDCVYKIEKPVVIFGDHTRVLKYIPFNFALGADGVKILLPNDTILSRYLYFCILLSKIPSLGYSRHYKLLKNLDVPVPPVSLQERFATQVEVIEKQKKLVEASIAELQTLLDSRMDYWFN